MEKTNHSSGHAQSSIWLVIEVIPIAHSGNIGGALNSTVMRCECMEDERPSEEMAEWLRVSKSLTV